MGYRFEDFLAANGLLNEGEFVARFSHPFLLSEGPTSGNTGRFGSGSELTGKIETDAMVVTGKTPPPAQPTGTEALYVVPLVRKATSKLAIVTVGRGEECDLHFSHPLVSKRHAYFKWEPDGWVLCDAESTNGTWVGGEKLEPHKPRKLADSDPIRFGPAVRYRYFLPASFHAYMSYRARIKK